MHELDPSAFTDVKSSSRHVRTRLYFTSESHILSLFNVLRYGHEVLAATQGERASRGVQCIFSDEARVKFETLDLPESPGDCPRCPEMARDYPRLPEIRRASSSRSSTSEIPRDL